MELKHRVVSGFLWTATEKFGSLAVHLCAMLMLLRLLEPADFGLVSMLAVFTAVANSIVDSGFSQALIQKKTVSRVDYDSVFWLNLGIAALLYLLMWALCKPIAAFYDTPELVRIAPWIFCIIPLSALGLIQTTVLMRGMNFRAISKANFAAAITAAVTAVVMAWFGFGVWALVCQTVALYAIRTAALWLLNDWRPSLRFSWASVRGLFGLGSKLFAVGMITQFFNNVSLMIVGRFYNATQLGLYSQPLKLRNASAEAISLPVQNVTFPAFSTLQDDDAKMKSAVRQVISVQSLVLFPAMLGLIAVADEGFLIAGKEKWLASVPYFKVLCLSALFMPLSNISLNLLKAKGEGGLLLRTEIVKKAFGFAAILYGATVSVMAVTWAFFAWTAFEMVVNLRFASRLTGYRLREQLTDTLPYVAMAAAVWGAAEGVGLLMPDASAYLSLTVKVVAGGAVYLALCLLFKPAAWVEAKRIVSEKFARLRGGSRKSG